MNVFWIVIAIISIIYFFAPENKQRIKWWYFALCAMLIVLTCIRDIDIGYDSRNYSDYFVWYRTVDIRSAIDRGLEPGYALLNKFIGLFTSSEQVFIAVLGIMTLIPLFIFIWKKSTNPILSLLIFVVMEHWFSVMGIFRQWCAIAIMTPAYDCIIKRKFWPFIVLVLIAFSFHMSAFFMIPLYFLYPMRITPFKIACSLAIAAGIYVFSDLIVMIISVFARNELMLNQDGGFTLLLVLWAMAILMFLLGRQILSERQMKLNYMGLVYSAVIQPLNLTYSGFARIHLYCWFGMILGIPRFIQSVSYGYDNRNVNLFKIIVIMLLAAWYYVTCNQNVYAFMKF